MMRWEVRTQRRSHRYPHLSRHFTLAGARRKADRLNGETLRIVGSGWPTVWFYTADRRTGDTDLIAITKDGAPLWRQQR